MMKNTDTHPCFDKKASKVYGRIHLPVAPKCNISCNYCNRKYDCVNESRPGVTAKVMLPDEALEHLNKMKRIMPYINTIGIAGPGDALANPGKSFSTIDKIRRKYPDMHICLSTNGLNLPDFVNEIKYMQVSHITVTVNAATVATAAKIYKWINYQGIKYRGDEGAAILLENQLTGIQSIVNLGVLVKVNFIHIPDINETELPDVVQKMDRLGVTLFNVMPFIPVEKTPFYTLRSPVPNETLKLKDLVRFHSRNLDLMDHCQQCRSDAAGLLGENNKKSCNSLITENHSYNHV